MLRRRCAGTTYQADGTKRPLGIPTFEDKVAQRAVVMLLESIYEQDFKSCSYGLRPGRSCHDALNALRKGIMAARQQWVLDADLRKYFDSLSHARLREILDLRIKDGVIRRMIDKWLNAGIMDDGEWVRPSAGSPQGGVISPLVSNVDLHTVLDEWFEEVVLPRMGSSCRLVRYADEFVMLLREKRDAMRVLKVLGKRLGKYGLTLHETKTRFIDFRVPQEAGLHNNASFDFLGFTHVWGTSRKGSKVLRQLTSKSRFARAVKSVSQWCRANRHRPLAEQHARLARVVRGHCAYLWDYGESKTYTVFTESG